MRTPFVSMVIEVRDVDGNGWRITPNPGPDPGNPDWRLDVDPNHGRRMEDLDFTSSNLFRGTAEIHWSAFTVITPHGGTVEELPTDAS